jgi:hypothetical protein
MDCACQERLLYRVAVDKSSNGLALVAADRVSQFVAGFALATNFANSAHGNVRPPWIGAIV